MATVRPAAARDRARRRSASPFLWRRREGSARRLGDRFRAAEAEFLAAKPGPLALGILRGWRVARRRSWRRGRLTAQIGGDLRHADGAHHRQGGGELAVEEAARPRRARRSRSSRRSAGRCAARGRASAAGRRRTSTSSLMPPVGAPCQLLSGAPVDRTTSSAGRSRVVSLACSRAAASGSSSAKRAVIVGHRSARTSARMAGSIGGHRGDAVEQRAKVEAGAADQDRQLPRPCTSRSPPWRRRPSRRRCRQRAVAVAEQAVLDPAPSRPPRAGADDPQVGDRPARCRR